jgi:hypothetical protein
MAGNWQFLSCIFNSLGRLDHPLYQPLAHDDYPREYRLLAFEDALRSGDVPLRGRRQGFFHLAPYECIEPNIDAEMAIDIALDGITLCKYCQEGPLRIEVAVFRQVQADMASVEQWLRENVLPAGGMANDGHVEESPRENILREDHVIDEPKAAGDEAPDDTEAECRAWLAALPEHRRITKKQAFERFNQVRQKTSRKHIGMRPFIRAWQKSVPLSWRARGRLPGT